MHPRWTQTLSQLIGSSVYLSAADPDACRSPLAGIREGGFDRRRGRRRSMNHTKAPPMGGRPNSLVRT